MKSVLALGLTLLLVLPLTGEYTFFTPPGSYTVEVSLDNSPYPRLPIYRNAIMSLAVVGDYAIGGTTAAGGLTPFLFAVSLSRRRLETAFALERLLPDQRSIQSGFGRARDGTLFAGTMPQESRQGGHIIAVRLRAGDLAVEDLGVPVPREGVFALTCDADGRRVYGISHPSGKFFVYDPAGRQAQVYEETAPSPKVVRFLDEYALKPEDYLARRLVADRQGRVYGSLPVNRLFRFDPAARKVEVLSGELPEAWGRRPLGRVDAWTLAPDGTLFGGNAGDGQVFRLDPSSGEVSNLGKPAMMPRIKGLAFDRNGALWGVAGGSPGYTHLFRYDPRAGGFTDYGNPRFLMTAPGIEQGIWWRGFQIGAVAASEDGRYIVLGEEEALSQLMVFPAP